MDNAAATTLYFDFMMNGNLNEVSGEYTIQREDEFEEDPWLDERSFMYIPIVQHPGLKKI